jgi:hypothetical protein
MDNYEINIFKQPYVLLRLIRIILKRFNRLCGSYEFLLLDNITISVYNNTLINKVKSIILINYKIKNNFLFQIIKKKIKRDIIINDSFIKSLNKILKKKKLSSLHEDRIVSKYNYYYKKQYSKTEEFYF